MDFVPCPHCGADIRADAKSCRQCGSSDADGWRDEFDGDDAFDDEDDQDFDDDSYVEDNFSPGLTNTQTAPIWRFVAALLLLGIVLYLLQLF